MVDFVKERLNKNEDLKDIIKELLHEIISPDYTKTSKVMLIIVIDGVGCDNMTCIIVKFKK